MERTAAHDAEVYELKESLRRAEELCCVKKQVEERQGMFGHCLALGTNQEVCLFEKYLCYAP